MATQQDVREYAQAIQAQLLSIVTPIPVYANFNRNYATQPKFITWQLRDVHQPVYTGNVQSIKGIDTPVFQISVFTQDMADGVDTANDILQALHGFSGTCGGGGHSFNVSKADVVWLYHGYDNEIGLHNIFMDCTIYIPT